MWFSGKGQGTRVANIQASKATGTQMVKSIKNTEFVQLFWWRRRISVEVPRVQVKLDLQEITLSSNDIFHCYLDFLSDLVIIWLVVAASYTPSYIALATDEGWNGPFGPIFVVCCISCVYDSTAFPAFFGEHP